MAALALFAGALRFYRLGTPPGHVFDEVYYLPDACRYITEAVFFCGSGEVTYGQPPVGKWLMAFGTFLQGPDASGIPLIGGRVAPAVLGSVSVLVVYLIGLRLLRSRLGAFVAAFLVAIDPLHLVMSRTGMLDMSALFFVVVAILFFLYDRDASSSRSGSEITETGKPLFLRDVSWSRLAGRWRVLSGVALGLAAGSKWSAAPVWAGIVALSLRDAHRRENAVSHEGREATTTSTLTSIVLPLVIIPLFVYATAYVGRLEGSFLLPPWNEGSWYFQFVIRQADMLDVHLGLRDLVTSTRDHPYASPPWSWPLLRRPVVFNFSIEGVSYREVLAVGNPLAWWPALAALFVLGWSTIRRTSAREIGIVIWVGFAATYLYWLLLPQSSSTYLYYFVLAVPFIYLAAGWMMTTIPGRPWRRMLIGAFLAANAGVSGFFYPVLTSQPLSRAGWERRIPLRDCDRFDGNESIPSPPAYDPDVRRLNGVLPNRSRASGWCWV